MTIRGGVATTLKEGRGDLFSPNRDRPAGDYLTAVYMDQDRYWTDPADECEERLAALRALEEDYAMCAVVGEAWA